MKVLIDLTAKEISYIRSLKAQMRETPLEKRVRDIPSVGIFLKIAKVVK